MGSIGILLAAVLLVCSGSGRDPGHRKRPEPRHFIGLGILPLSGDLSDLGKAFRDGFLAGLSSGSDSLFDWRWTWVDDSGNAQTSGELLRSPAALRSGLVLVGLSSAATGLEPCPVQCMVLDDGGAHPPDSLRWDLWTSSSRMRDRWIRRLRGSPGPAVVVSQASAAWTEPVFPVLADSVPGLSVILHDPDNRRWDDAVQSILQARPSTVVLWDSPDEATSLLSRRLLWPLLRRSRLWVPFGTTLPPGVSADTLRPVWQAGPGTSTEDWASWGRKCGEALARSSRIRLVDSLPRWPDAFRRIPSDSRLESEATGWYPSGP